MVSLTERVIHLEKQSENAAKKDVVERHDRDVRTMQTSLTQVRAQVVQLERLSLSEGRSGSGETAQGLHIVYIIPYMNYKVKNGS